MKRPEEYLENFVIDNGEPYYTEGEVLGMLKSMREDAEKELIELLKYSDKMMVSSSHEGLSWDQAKSYEEKLTQFRNKQQDR